MTAESFDVVIVGAGPAGLAAAIRLGQLAAEHRKPLRVAVLEKGVEVGAHIVSGAILDPRALDGLLPGWRERGAPAAAPVREEQLLFLSARRAWRWPNVLLPPELHNRGNYVVSLGALCRWLAAEAEALGVDVLPGFAATRLLDGGGGDVAGVATGAFGLGRDGGRTSQYQPGMELPARVTLLAEGCHGSLTREAVACYRLGRDAEPQTYGLGMKEVWRLPPQRRRPGAVVHTVGWPLRGRDFGGGFFYQGGDGLAHVGFVVGLDYDNP